jgi:hypothetical protein
LAQMAREYASYANVVASLRHVIREDVQVEI